MFSKKEQQEIHHKLKILNDAKQCNNVTVTCRKYRLAKNRSKNSSLAYFLLF